MILKYLFSAPKGDIAIAPHELTKPFKIGPSENHSFLTLGDYFESIRKFLLQDQADPFLTLLQEHLGKRIQIDHIDKLLIRSEKHGALYHLASIEISVEGHLVKYAINTAVSEKDKARLEHEYDLLGYLGETFNLPYLPRVYFKGQLECQAGTQKTSLSMFLAEWFEDYHEWHLSVDEADKTQKLRIWDQISGHRFATQEEGFEIYRQVAKILTLYYDIRDSRQIYPWHHAAGDFVVGRKDGDIDVRLTTARAYEPLITFLEEKDINPMVALIYFFLNLTIKTRLDRLDGLGDMAWAGDFTVEATTEGFFQALRIKDREQRYHLGRVKDFLNLLRSFSAEELHRLYQPLLELYREEAPGDLSLITNHLEDHTQQLYQVIQRLRE